MNMAREAVVFYFLFSVTNRVELLEIANYRENLLQTPLGTESLHGTFQYLYIGESAGPIHTKYPGTAVFTFASGGALQFEVRANGSSQQNHCRIFLNVNFGDDGE